MKTSIIPTPGGYRIHMADRRRQQAEALGANAYRVFEERNEMQAQLERIRKLGGGPQTFLHMTQAIGGALGAGPQLTIEALNFHDQTLDMRLSAANVDALSSLTQAVSRQGFTAEIQSSTPTGDRVEAHVQLRTPHPGSK